MKTIIRKIMLRKLKKLKSEINEKPDTDIFVKDLLFLGYIMAISDLTGYNKALKEETDSLFNEASLAIKKSIH